MLVERRVSSILWFLVFDIRTDNLKLPDSKVHEAYMGPTWGQQDPGGPHVGPMNPAIRVILSLSFGMSVVNE